jgi:hypothetical protein
VSVIIASLRSLITLAPLTVDDPALDPDEARRLLEQELQRGEYQEAEPAWFDIAGQAIVDFFERLLNPEGDGVLGTGGLIVAAALIIALIVTAFIVWGRPRSVVRSTQRVAELFGEAEQRSARELRRAAETAARAQRFDEAIVLRVRALARSLGERGIVMLPPGATVQAFARRAAVPFPEFTAQLDAAANAFDDVRYLRGTGSETAYALVRDLDAALAGTHPGTLPELAGSGVFDTPARTQAPIEHAGAGR